MILQQSAAIVYACTHVLLVLQLAQVLKCLVVVEATSLRLEPQLQC